MPEATSDFGTRAGELVRYFADRQPDEYLSRIGFIEIGCRLHRQEFDERTHEVLLEILQHPHGDMFWMYPMVFIEFEGGEQLPPATRTLMRRLWQTYTPYRGDTENHWLLYYASLFLMAERYPDDGPESWFNGRSSSENMSEASDYLLHWADVTCRRGQGEFSSPHYMAFFFAPLAQLFAYATDNEIRTVAHIMLDYLVADFAVDQLNGLCTGAFSRIYPEPLLERWRNASTTFAWLLFGNIPFRPDAINIILPRIGYRPHGSAAILAASGYEPPEIIRSIATDRSKPFVQLERKRTRSRIRYAPRDQDVYKYSYMCSDYAVGSIQGGLLQPIQQHTWEVQWAIDDPFEGFNVLFCLHPYSSGHELGMYFPEEPKIITRTVIQGEKPTYSLTEKWTGGSPFEQVFQHEDAVIVLYELPPLEPVQHIDAYFSRHLQERATHESGWITAQAGRAFVAYYPIASYEWIAEPGGDWRLHSRCSSDSLNGVNGAIIQVAPAEQFEDVSEFAEAIANLQIDIEEEPSLSCRFTTLRGRRLEFAYNQTPTVDGQLVDYASWPLFSGPFLNAPPDAEWIELRAGKLRRRLDLTNRTITDS